MFAAWDLAFHCISMALVDSDFAKEQLILMVGNGTCIPMVSFWRMSGP